MPVIRNWSPFLQKRGNSSLGWKVLRTIERGFFLDEVTQIVGETGKVQRVDRRVTLPISDPARKQKGDGLRIQQSGINLPLSSPA